MKATTTVSLDRITRRNFFKHGTGSLAGISLAPLALPVVQSTPRKSGLKITRLEPLLYHVEGQKYSRNWIFVRVHTDAGIIGIGECGFTNKATTIKAYLEDLERRLIGQDALDRERVWQFMYRECYERGGPVVMSAIAGVDIALWDIAGKHLGAPVCTLLGGKCRDKVPVLTTIDTDLSAPEIAERGRALAARGFRTLRLYAPRGHQDMALNRLVNEIGAKVSALREAVGDNVDICLDIHRRLRVFEAITLAKELEQYRLLFIEDPIMPENMDAMAEVARSTSIPIATGENLYTLYSFRDLLSKRAARFVRIDLCLAGGFTQAKKIAALAEAEFAGVIPHLSWSPVATAAYAQFSASIQNLVALEYWLEDKAPNNLVVDQVLELEKGFLKLPDRPGIGIELNMKEIARSKYKYGDNPFLTREDGSITDW